MIVRRLTRDERGVAAVEFAITSPVYLLALFGLAQAGLWLWADFSLQRAADAASRWASIQCGPKLTACAYRRAQLQSYAVNNIVGLSVPSSAFSLTTSNRQLQRRLSQRCLWRADLHVRSRTARHHCPRKRLLPDLSGERRLRGQSCAPKPTQTRPSGRRGLLCPEYVDRRPCCSFGLGLLSALAIDLNALRRAH